MTDPARLEALAVIEQAGNAALLARNLTKVAKRMLAGDEPLLAQKVSVHRERKPAERLLDEALAELEHAHDTLDSIYAQLEVG